MQGVEAMSSLITRYAAASTSTRLTARRASYAAETGRDTERALRSEAENDDWAGNVARLELARREALER